MEKQRRESLIREHVKYDMCCLDIGAGEGETARLMSGLVGRRCGWVYAIEPCRYDVLEANVARWKLSNVTAVQAVVMPYTGSCVAERQSRTFEPFFRTLAIDPAKDALYEAMNCITVDDFCAPRGKINVMVIHSGVNVRRVLTGARQTILAWKPIVIGDEPCPVH